jgi:hypothetical protein
VASQVKERDAIGKKNRLSSIPSVFEKTSRIR